MFKHYFEIIEGISVYPVFSLLLFFVFFLVLGLYVGRMSKQEVHSLSQMPLEESPSQENISADAAKQL
jgi:hypothetical protein